MANNKTTKFQFFDTPRDVAELLVQDERIVEYIYGAGDEPDDVDGYFRTRIPINPSTFKYQYEGVCITHTNKYANYRDIVHEARRQFGEDAVEKVAKPPKFQFTPEQRMRAAGSTALYWIKVKEACLSGDVSWIKQSYPKFYATRQDFILKWVEKGKKQRI